MIGRSHHAQQRRRRWFAATACVLWLLGVEVLPDLHLAFHADDHTHGAEGTIVHAAARDGDRDHDAVHAEHHHQHDHGAPVMLAAAPAAEQRAPLEGHEPALATDDGEPVALVWRAPAAAGDEHDHHVAPARAHDAHDAHYSHRAHRERCDGASTIDLAPSAHDAAGVAHHALALHRPPPPLLDPLPVPRATWRIEREPEPQLHDALRARPNARGPPAAA